MKHRNRIFVAAVATLGLAAFAGSQLTYRGFAPYVNEPNFGSAAMVSQIVSHARLMEGEILNQRTEVQNLRKELQTLKDSFKKDLEEMKAENTRLTKRVRTLEITQGRRN